MNSMRMIARASSASIKASRISANATSLVIRRSLITCSSKANNSYTEPAPETTRRAALIASAVVMAGGVALSAGPAQAAGAACELTTAANGMQFCDTEEGTGKSPVPLNWATGIHWSVCLTAAEMEYELDRATTLGRLASTGRVFDSS
eukprot:gene13023-3531_t